MRKCYVLVLTFLLNILLVGCNSNEHDVIKQDTFIDCRQQKIEKTKLLSQLVSNDNLVKEESIESVAEDNSENVKEDSEYSKYYTEIAIDYDLLISQGYEILEENVLSVVAGDIKEHPLLKEALHADIEMDLEAQQEFGTEPATMEYFVYDINNDGLEDYLVCCAGILFEGSRGNSFDIYVQEKDSLRRVFSVTAEIHYGYGENLHSPMAILKDSNAGYYSFVLPWTRTIWRYCAEEEKYSEVIYYRD